MKYTVIEQFDQPIKQFAEWAGKYDKLIARVQLTDGTVGFLGQRMTVTYIVDEQHKPLAKTCSKSGVLLSTEMFRMHTGRLFDLQSICFKYNAGYYTENKERISEYNAKYRAENKERIAERKAEYYAENKERIAERKAEYKERIAEYRAENKERIAEYNVKYRAENKEKIAEIKAKYRAENKEKIAEIKAKYRAENKEKIAGYNVKYRAENPHIIRKCKHRRRAVKLAAYTDSQFLSELENSPNRTCRLTGYSVTSKEINLEHLMPISVTGSFPYGNSEFNCYHLLGSLNISKSNKNVFDWINSMTEEHLQFLLQDYPVTLSLEQFKTGMLQIITELAEKQGLTLEEYREQYNKDYAEGLQNQEQSETVVAV